ncbi:hypothetical protein [Bradyrhizobium guangdongense]|uniref:hypothetical protein n=1 Tax=Bradyrhizobium guangdongense TaxID=1325090 RepID=UPI001009AB7C|nr:hypothetical protein [Bradyrhizobium guangdongense]
MKIEKGRWYFGFICPHCGANIYSLDDPTQGGTKGPVAIGEAKFSVPCRSCETDEILFGTHELVPLQAHEDLLGSPALPRRKPSGKARQKLSNRYPKAKATFGIRFIEDQPECAVIFARCVVKWSYVENETALLLAKILKINTEPALAMFLAMQSSRVQIDVLTAAARTALSADDFKLFQAIMNIRRTMEGARNHLVHGLIGGSTVVKDGVLWTDQKDYVRHTATVWGTDYAQMHTKYLEEVFVYEADDLETIAQDLEWLHRFIGNLWGYLDSSDVVWRAERYHQLCTEPRVQAELQRMARVGQQS